MVLYRALVLLGSSQVLYRALVLLGSSQVRCLRVVMAVTGTVQNFGI